MYNFNFYMPTKVLFGPGKLEIIPELNIPDDDPLKAYRIQYRISTSLSLFRLWIRRGKDLSVDELLQLVWNLYLNGSSSLDQ